MTSKITHNIGIVLFCTICAFLYALFFYQSLSPLYIVEGADNCVFKMMGLAILNGKIPYVDIFDHKGPLLYYIEALGQWLYPGRMGLFILSVVALAISIFYWYKSARLVTTPTKSYVVVLLTLLSYYYYVGSGNVSEDWNIPFISVAYYYILSILLKDDNEKGNLVVLYGILVGVCLSCSFFIRPNDAVAFIGSPIFGVFLWELKERKVNMLFKWIVGVCGGFILITSIFIVWFYINNALSELWYGLIGFNTKYATGLKGLLKGCAQITKVQYIPFLVTLLLLGVHSKCSRILYVLAPTVAFAYILLGNNGYIHYWKVWTPVIFFTYWLLTIADTNKIISLFAVCVFLSLPLKCNWLKTPLCMYREIVSGMEYRDVETNNTSSLFESIKPEDRDSIWSYNLTWHGVLGKSPNTFKVLLYNNIVPCNRVPLIFMAEVDSSLLNDMDITRTNPKYILYSSQNTKPATYFVRDSVYLDAKYHVVATKEDIGIVLYERNYANNIE